MCIYMGSVLDGKAGEVEGGARVRQSGPLWIYQM